MADVPLAGNHVGGGKQTKKTKKGDGAKGGGKGGGKVQKRDH